MAINKNRVQLYLGDNIKEYLDKQSEEFGMSVSAYVTMCINVYKQQTESLTEIRKLNLKLEELQNNELNNK